MRSDDDAPFLVRLVRTLRETARRWLARTPHDDDDPIEHAGTRQVDVRARFWSDFRAGQREADARTHPGAAVAVPRPTRQET